MNFDDLPLADPAREQHALSLFPLNMTPEEYAARFGHEWVSFSFDERRYSAPGLTEWIQRLGDILFGRNGAPSVRELRERFLTPAEITAAEAREREPL
jgi:hypothetical protein